MVLMPEIFISMVAAGLVKEDHEHAEGELAPSGSSGNTDKAEVIIAPDDKSKFSILYCILFGDFDDQKITAKILLNTTSRHEAPISKSLISDGHPIYSISTPGTPTAIKIQNDDTLFYQHYDFTVLSVTGDIDKLNIVKQILANYYRGFGK